MAKKLIVNTFGELSKVEGIQDILPHEFEVAGKLKEQGLLEELFVKDGAKGAFAVFNETDVEKVKGYIAQLPLSKYFEKVEYTIVDKSF